MLFLRITSPLSSVTECQQHFQRPRKESRQVRARSMVRRMCLISSGQKSTLSAHQMACATHRGMRKSTLSAHEIALTVFRWEGPGFITDSVRVFFGSLFLRTRTARKPSPFGMAIPGAPCPLACRLRLSLKTVGRSSSHCQPLPLHCTFELLVLVCGRGACVHCVYFSLRRYLRITWYWAYSRTHQL